VGAAVLPACPLYTHRPKLLRPPLLRLPLLKSATDCHSVHPVGCAHTRHPLPPTAGGRRGRAQAAHVGDRHHAHHAPPPDGGWNRSVHAGRRTEGGLVEGLYLWAKFWGCQGALRIGRGCSGLRWGVEVDTTLTACGRLVMGSCMWVGVGRSLLPDVLRCQPHTRIHTHTRAHTHTYTHTHMHTRTHTHTHTHTHAGRPTHLVRRAHTVDW